VYKGTWRDNIVAIKIIMPRNSSDPSDDNEKVKREIIAAFEEEANLVYSLTHPNIVTASMVDLVDVQMKIHSMW
jgi:serine/threonine protein kinase